MVRPILPLLLVLAAVPLGAETRGIAGRVVDTAGVPLPGVTVTLLPGTRTAVSDEQGAFRFDGVPPGPHQIRAELSGFAPVTRDVVAAEGAAPVVVTLEPGAYVFEQVQVVERGYAARRSLTSTRTATDLRTLPQAIQVINGDLFRDQGATYLNDTLKNASGINAFSDYLDFNMRGFRTSADGAVKRDGLNQVHDFFFRPRLMNVERVEVVKGPAGALYGQSRPGGFVNIISRQPSAEPLTEASVHLGSFGKSEAHLMSTGPVPNTGGRLFYLGEVSRIDNDGFRAHERFVYTGLSGSLTWAPGANTAMTVGGEWFDDLARGHRNRGIPFFRSRIVDVPIAFTVNEPSDLIEIRAQTVRGRLDHRFSDAIRLDVTASRLSNENTQQYHEPRGLRADGRTMLREFRDQYREKTQTAANGNLEWVRAFAGTEHRLLLGAEYTLTEGLGRFGTARDSGRGGPVPALDIHAPVYAPLNRPLSFGYYGPGVPGGIAALTTTSDNRVRSSGIYAQDQVRLGSRLNLLGGIRVDAFEDRTRSGQARSRRGSAVSTRAGAVLDVTPAVSLYGSFAEGFEPPPADLSLDPGRYGGPFDPETSWSIEGGVKGAWLANRLIGTFSTYHITKRDVILYSPTDALPDRYVQVGAFESRGVEVDLSGRVTSALSVQFNYAHSFLAEITRDVDPANVGKPAENNPSHAANAWVRYTVPLRWRDASLGGAAGVRFVDDRLTFQPGDVLPSYVTADAAAFFDVQRVRVSLNAFNLANREHFTGGYGGRIGAFRGMPRAFEVRIRYRF